MKEQKFDPEKHIELPQEEGGGFVDKTALDKEKAMEDSSAVWDLAHKIQFEKLEGGSHAEMMKKYYSDNAVQPYRENYNDANNALILEKAFQEYDQVLDRTDGTGMYMPKYTKPETLIPDLSPSAKQENKKNEGYYFSTGYADEYLKIVPNELKTYGHGFDAFFAEFTSCNPEQRETLRHQFPGLYSLVLMKDQIVIDLGCGTGIKQSIYTLANVAGARGYIGVDKDKFYTAILRKRLMFGEPPRGLFSEDEHDLDPAFLYQFPSQTPGEQIEQKRKKLAELCELFGVTREKAIPFSTVSEDMLAFLRRLPDNSVCFVFSGINSALMADKKEGKEYMPEVFREMKRAINQNSGAISVGSDYDFAGELKKITETEPKLYRTSEGKKVKKGFFEVFRK